MPIFFKKYRYNDIPSYEAVHVRFYPFIYEKILPVELTENHEFKNNLSIVLKKKKIINSI